MYVCIYVRKQIKGFLPPFREVIEMTKEMMMVMQERNPAIRPSLAIIQVGGATSLNVEFGLDLKKKCVYIYYIYCIYCAVLAVNLKGR